MLPYLDMIETAFIGFLVSGAFLGLANFDLFYQLVASTIIVRLLVRNELAVKTTKEPALVPSLVESEAI